MKIQKNNFENSILNSTPVMSLRAANIFQGFRKTEGKKWMKERKRKRKEETRQNRWTFWNLPRFWDLKFFSTNFSYLVIQEVNSDEKENSVHEDI